MTNKIVIVINGVGGVGKDTFINAVGQYYKTQMISSITPIKEMAAICGWNGEKTLQARKFLADLKQLTIQYNNYPTSYLVQEYEKFLKSDFNILFVVIREPEEIKKFKTAINNKCYTLLIQSNRIKLQGQFGNLSDDRATKDYFTYDFTYQNDSPKEDVVEQVKLFFENTILQRDKN